MMQRYPKDYQHPKFRAFLMWSGALAWSAVLTYLLFLLIPWAQS